MVTFGPRTTAGQPGYNKGDSGSEEPSGDFTGHFGGTSAAAPVVTGVAALIWAECPTLTAAQVRQALETTAKKEPASGGGWVNGRSKVYGNGRVDPMAALVKAKQMAGGNAPAGGGGTAGIIESAIKAGESGLSFSVGGENVRLEPRADVIGVIAPKGTGAWSKAIDELRAQGSPGEIHDLGTVGELYVFQQNALRNAAKRNRLDEGFGSLKITPVYSGAKDDSLLIPTGKIRVKAKGDQEVASIVEVAKSKGLEMVQRRGRTLTFKPQQSEAILNPGAALRAFESSGLIEWAEPDLARQLQR